MENTYIIVGLIFAGILAILLIWYFWPPFNRKKRRQQLMFSYYPTASAGASTSNKPDEAKSVSVEFNCFRDKDGNVIDPTEYLQFVVEGNSMQFCGIHDKDLIFVAKEFRIVQLKKFPYVLVLKNSKAEAGHSKYKVRRAWAISQYGDDRFEDDVRAIMNSLEFQEIKRLKGVDGNDAYMGDEQVIRDFLTNRLPMYEKKYIECENPDIWNRTVVISTTFDTDDKYIHFSIHPIANIVGIVKDAFTVNVNKEYQ